MTKCGFEYQSKLGEKAGMQAHPASVAYFFGAAKFKFTSPDGKTAEAEVKTGQVIQTSPNIPVTDMAGYADLVRHTWPQPP
jgi:hypothetical protein